MNTLIELVKLSTATVAFCAVIYGFDKWRRELVGKRKCELALEILEQFYKARNAILIIRRAGILKYETQEQNYQDNPFNVFYNRLNSQRDIISKINTLQFKYMALFGANDSKLLKPFNELNKLINEIIVTLDILHEDHTTYSDVRQGLPEHYKAQIIEMRSKVISSGENDDINIRLTQIIIDIENICQPIINTYIKPTTLEGTMSILHNICNALHRAVKKP
jgi:hypothetical protein